MTLTTDTKAAGITAFEKDVYTPSAALLSFQRKTSDELLNEAIRNDDAEQSAWWGKKMHNLMDNPCSVGDRFDTKCGDWRIEFRKEGREEERDDVDMNNDVRDSGEKIAERRAVVDDKATDREVEAAAVSSTDKAVEKEVMIDDGIRVIGMDVPLIEENDSTNAKKDSVNKLHIDNGIKVTGMHAPSEDIESVTSRVKTTPPPKKEVDVFKTVEKGTADTQNNSVVETPTEQDTNDITETVNETWIDQISDNAHNMCTAISNTACSEQSKETVSRVSNKAIESLRNIPSVFNVPEEDEEAEVIKVSNLTEMALNGDRDDASIAKEVLVHAKQIEHEKQFSIVEDVKKMLPHVKSTMNQIASHAKSTWSFVSTVVGSLKSTLEDAKKSDDAIEDTLEDKTIKTEARTVSAKTIKTEANTVANKTIKTEAPSDTSGVFPEESIPDDITVPESVATTGAFTNQSLSSIEGSDC
eukprot:scaffold58011_cov76-Cyclotella_meneghiniana.AAC.2